MTIQRRSERLRRKARQSTPGVTKPAAYKLYGSSYVCESEASIATSSQYKLPTDSRRARYLESPHCLQVETSAPVEDTPISPPPPRRHSALGGFVSRQFNSVYESMRDSPILRNTRSFTRFLEDDDDIVIEEDEDEDEDVDVTTVKFSAAWRAFRSVLHIPPQQRPSAYLFLLAALLASAVLVLSQLSQLSTRPPRPPAAVQLKLASWSAFPRLSLPNRPALPQFDLPTFHRPDFRAKLTPWLKTAQIRTESAKVAMKTGVATAPRYVAKALKYMQRFAFGGAWRRRAGSVTRDEWAEELEPRILARAREIAREEARSMSAFAAHRERYAADKGLPPDYALASAGASVLWARPTTARLLSLYVLSYARFLLSDNALFKPSYPQNPLAALSPDVSPGQCWCFPASSGAIAIRLARPVVPIAFTIEHTPQASVFATRTAPRTVRVSLIPRDASQASIRDGRALQIVGEFSFAPQDGHLATFHVDSTVEAKAVVLEVLNNHGASETCLYRFRVHGENVGI